MTNIIQDYIVVLHFQCCKNQIDRVLERSESHRRKPVLLRTPKSYLEHKIN